MSLTVLFSIGTVTVALLAIFVYMSVREMRHSPAAMMPFYGEPPDEAARRAREWDERAARASPASPVIERTEPLTAPTPRPLRVLVATDGSPCSDRAVQSVAIRPWPAGSQIEVISIVHARIPEFPDPQLMIEAAHVEALEAERQRAPGRVMRAQRCFQDKPGITVTTKVVEGAPVDALLQEARQCGADVIVVGSHGYGPVKRRLLGSVSEGIALHASCSVEIVR